MIQARISAVVAIRRLAPRDHHKAIAREQFGAADDDQNKAERKGAAAQEARDTPWQRRGSGHGRDHGDGAKRDERTGENAQHQERE
jgi:hypothetical protein